MCLKCNSWVTFNTSVTARGGYITVSSPSSFSDQVMKSVITTCIHVPYHLFHSFRETVCLYEINELAVIQIISMLAELFRVV